MDTRGFIRSSLLMIAACLALSGLSPAARAQTPAGCTNITHADVVALDQPWMWNRFGAMEPQGMMYALRRDVVPTSDADGLPDVAVTYTLNAGQVKLRRDKRPRPLTLRVHAGGCLHVKFTNLLSPTVPSDKDEQPATRGASMHFVGLEAVTSIKDMGANVGNNPASGNGIVAPGGSIDYWLYAPAKEGTYVIYSAGAMTGGEGDSGSIAAGLFGAVNVEPPGSVWYRSQVTRDDLNRARTGTFNAAVDSFPVINYNATYPAGNRYQNLPILKMTNASNEIVHSDLTAIISTGGGTSTNTYPNRTQPFREFTIIFHDEIGAVQAFPQFESDQLFHTLQSVRDAFAINYGTGGAGAEILANRVGVGPARDCPECMYEEFFLSSWALGDPSMVVDKPANAPCTRAQIEAGNTGCYTLGSKASIAYYPDDPSNVYHSYLSDHVKFRNTHAGSDDHHIFHLHAHQWLHSPESDKSSYKDSQSIGQGAGYTYEIAYNGSGNRNKTVGDSIFHCHFYPHFAQGMWSLWRVHDVLELGTRLDSNGRPAAGARALPDNEILAGTPIPAVVPLPNLAMAPLPGQVSINNATGQVQLPGTVTTNPGYPFFVPGIAGRRSPHPPMDFAKDGLVPMDGGLARHVVVSGTATSTQSRFNFEKKITKATVKWLAEAGEPVEQVAMNFHAAAGHSTFTPSGAAATFKVNGHPATQGAPFADPCFDDAGNVISSVRRYKAANLQLDVKLNKAGWHFPQQRMISLWSDVDNLLAGKAPEPFFFRANSGECVEFWHTNLVPNKYIVDDFQVTTPTDILGQHIHLVKFDVMASDGGGNGWNYEDGSFAGQEVQERICAIRQAQVGRCGEPSTTSCTFAGTPTANCPVPKKHPYFTRQDVDQDCDGHNDFLGAQTTVQRWWADPITNLDGGKRTLRTVFTHDHFGPSTHQQSGLYAGLIVEPPGTTWFHNETGVQLSTNNGAALGNDGGPTSWQAVVQGSARADNYREFMIEFADFQPAYEPGGPVCPARSMEIGWIDPARAVNPPAKEEVGLTALYEKADECPVPDGSTTFLAPPCPEAVSAADIGMTAVNYRNEPLGLRIRNPFTNTQANGLKGDMSYAYQSRTDRADAAFNSQPGFYAPLTSGLYPGDPFTPMLRAFEGDQIKVRTLVGAHEEPHNFTMHGLKWLHEPDDPNSGYRNSQMMGISEWFDIEIPRVPSLIDGRFADFLYKPSAAVESQWTGAWGILRVYRNNDRLTPANSKFQLMPLTSYNNVARAEATDEVLHEITVEQAREEQVAGGDIDSAAITPTDESAVVATGSAFEASTLGASMLVSPGVSTTASPTPVGTRTSGTIKVACPVGRVYKDYEIAAVAASEVLQNDPIPGGLVYNSRSDTVTGPSGSFTGPLIDPTAIMFVYRSDLTFVGGRPRLNQNVRREPLILRGIAGECMRVKLWNYLPGSYADQPGYSGVNMIVEGFNQNDFRTSRHVSLHPQLVYYDVQRSDGTNVGINPSQFGVQTVAPNNFRTYYWYAGDVRGATVIPIEFGATGLTSSDPIKHSNKGLMGSLIIEPPTSQWTYDTDSAGKITRASAKINSSNSSFKTFQEFAFVIQDDVNLQFAKGTPVPNLEIDDDPENSGQKAVNYRAEPLWFRGGWTPDTPLTGDGPGFRTRQFTQFDQILHNSWVGGDPETPVFSARIGTPLRLRVTHPSGHTQSHVFEVHGHPWLAMPYTTNSTVIGNNTTSFWMGTRGGVGPSDHFDALVLDGPGGKFNITGDYLYRSYGGPRMDAGIWGLIRVLP